MKHLLIGLLLVSLALAQTEVTVYTTSREGKVGQFEKELINNIFMMYNAKNASKIKAKFVKTRDFKHSFEVIDKRKDENIMVINSITISNERKKKYDFSEPYLPVWNSILVKSDSKAGPMDWQKPGAKIGYTPGTQGETLLTRLNRNLKFKMVPYNNRDARIAGLKKGEVDFMFGDNILSWDDKSLKVIYEFVAGDVTSFGIMYPKGSKYKSAMDGFIKYYLKSPKFFRFSQKLFGKAITDYFKKFN